MSEIDVGVMVRAEGGEWKRLSRELDEMNDPAVMAVQRQLEQEAAQARLRARMHAVDAEIEEDAARRSHLAGRLKEAYDTFTADMLRLAKEQNDE